MIIWKSDVVNYAFGTWNHRIFKFSINFDINKINLISKIINYWKKINLYYK